MKRYQLLLVPILAIVLSSCAQQRSNTVSAVAPEKSAVAQTNESVLRSNIEKKLSMLDFNSLRATNNFIDSIWEMRADPSLSVLVLTVKEDSFPVFLQRIMESNENIKRIPRSKKFLIVLENKDIPGVQNVFIEIPAEYMKEGDNIFNWMPNMEVWLKSIDLHANRLSHLPPDKAFLKMFWMANKLKNPELISVLKKNNWDWTKMPHPKDTAAKAMYIPAFTLNEATRGLMK